MNNENFLLDLVNTVVRALDLQMETIKSMPVDGQPSEVIYGKLIGLSSAKDHIHAVLRLYERKLKEEHDLIT